MTAKQIYSALKQQMPNVSDVVIGNQIGICHSAVSKLRLGYGVGLKAALWLSEKDSAYKPLYKEAQAQEKASRCRREANRKATRTMNDGKGVVDLAGLSPGMQQWCGYLR